MQFKKRRELPRARIEIIPMIDTMFFLLVFFMLSSLALTKLNGLPVDLPQASTAPRQAPAELTITIEKNQRISVNQTPVTLQTLGKILREEAGAGADLSLATLILNADSGVPHGVVVSCIDGAREVGIAKFAIATSPDEGAIPTQNPGGDAR